MSVIPSIIRIISQEKKGYTVTTSAKLSYIIKGWAHADRQVRIARDRHAPRIITVSIVESGSQFICCHRIVVKKSKR